jgi:ElaB/YqjD/DUF883 family membrane-anchored ribosome-binding protein
MSSITDDGTQSGSGAEQVKERVQDAAGEAKSRVREQLRTQVDERSTTVGKQLSSTATAMRGTSERLRGEGNDKAASAIDAVADRSQRLGAYLERVDGDGLLRDVEDFARRQPWLMAGGSAVVGFLASRFMKASSTSRYRARGPQPGGYVVPSPAGVDGPRGHASGVDVPTPSGTPAATGGGTGGLG